MTVQTQEQVVVSVTHLADASSPVPDKVVPVPVVFQALVHDLGDQVIHGHAEHRQGAELVGQRLLLVC